MPPNSRAARAKKPLPPLDPAALQAIAVRYVERYQASRARLVRLLNQKIRQRGWADGLPAPDVDAIADRMVALGYIDDRAFAESRARSQARRGLGRGRVRQTLSANGIDAELQGEVLSGLDSREAALLFARRKRLGPFGPPPADRRAEARQLAAMARAGHPQALALAIIRARSEDDLPTD